MNDAELRALLRDAWSAALASIDLGALVAAQLPRGGPRTRVLAVGKAAPAMAEAALDRLGPSATLALVVTTDGTDARGLAARADVRFAGHPLPDERSVAAADLALAMAAAAGEDDLLVALISGGASAVLAAPPRMAADAAGDLAALRSVVADLVASEATILEVNTVRRHLSRVAGGRLALAAAPARVLTLYARDVPHGRAHDVGSGPTVPCPTTTRDAHAVAERWLGAARAAALAPFLSDGLTPTSPQAARTIARPIATPHTLGEHVARALRARGFEVELDPEWTGPARTLVERHAERAPSLARGHAIVLPCEPTLRPVPGGRGGRAGWSALALLGRLPRDVAFLAAASDGVDGSSGAAGACVSGALAFDRAAAADALARFDDAPLHALLGSALAGGPSGINLTDVHVLARAPD